MTDPEDTTPFGDGVAERDRGVLTTLDGADVGIFLLGPDFRVRWINEAVEEYFGLRREAVVGEDKRALIDSTIKSIFERPDRFAGTVTDTYEDNTYVEEFECHVLAGDGRAERWLLHRSRPIENGPFAGGRMEQYTDITGRKEREQALERERDRLDEFASVVSHDLRNPLTVATGRLHVAREECESPHLDTVATALDRMERIVDDVLWLAREGRDIGSTERVDLRTVIESTWELVAEEPDSPAFVCAVESGHAIEADTDRLRQLLENLFRNAIDHGGQGPTVRVESIDGGFAVEDDGPGIPPAERETVFDAGYSSSETGTGFGLRIVEQVARAHGWTVSVAEGANGGARFEITGVERAD